jgi:hypothetical protein
MPLGKSKLDAKHLDISLEVRRTVDAKVIRGSSNFRSQVRMKNDRQTENAWIRGFLPPPRQGLFPNALEKSCTPSLLVGLDESKTK